MTTEKIEKKESAWNLSQQIINQIGFLLSQASQHFLAGSIQQSFHAVEEIAILIDPFLNTKESEKIEKLSAEICDLNSKIIREIRQREIGGNNRQKTNIRENKNNHAKKIRQYRRIINRLIGKYGLGLSLREDRSKFF